MIIVITTKTFLFVNEDDRQTKMQITVTPAVSAKWRGALCFVGAWRSPKTTDNMWHSCAPRCRRHGAGRWNLQIIQEKIVRDATSVMNQKTGWKGDIKKYMILTFLKTSFSVMKINESREIARCHVSKVRLIYDNLWRILPPTPPPVLSFPFVKTPHTI
jgi:hypothetical protein